MKQLQEHKKLLREDLYPFVGLHFQTTRPVATGLTAAMYLDERGVEVPSPDAEAGLYIRDRSGTFVHAAIPADCIAFQVWIC